MRGRNKGRGGEGFAGSRRAGCKQHRNKCRNARAFSNKERKTGKQVAIVCEGTGEGRKMAHYGLHYELQRGGGKKIEQKREGACLFGDNKKQTTTRSKM